MKYRKILEKHFPEIEYDSNGDGSLFSHIAFIAETKTEAELDALWLPILKNDRIDEINQKTDELIEQGFTFDSNQFSLHPNIKTDWLGIMVMKDYMTFPKTIINMQGGGYSLTLANVIPFVGAGMGTYESYISSGATLKAQILAATDEAGVTAIVDNR